MTIGTRVYIANDVFRPHGSKFSPNGYAVPFGRGCAGIYDVRNRLTATITNGNLGTPLRLQVSSREMPRGTIPNASNGELSGKI